MDPFYQWGHYPPPLNQPNNMFYLLPANAVAEQPEFWQNFSAAAGAGPSSPSTSYDSSSRSSSPKEPSSKKQRSYNKWTDEQEKLLVQLWAEKHPNLESKDVRKEWQEIVSELNVRLGANKSQEQCSRKMQCLISKYKEAHDWNVRQTGGYRKTSSYYEEINEVLGCRDVMTFRHVVGSSGEEKEPKDVDKSTKASDDESEDVIKTPGRAEDPREKHRERKTPKQQKRPRKLDASEEDEEEKQLLKRVIDDMRDERVESREFMNKFSELQSKQLDTMNSFWAAITEHLKNRN